MEKSGTKNIFLILIIHLLLSFFFKKYIFNFSKYILAQYKHRTGEPF